MNITKQEAIEAVRDAAGAGALLWGKVLEPNRMVNGFRVGCALGQIAMKRFGVQQKPWPHMKPSLLERMGLLSRRRKYKQTSAELQNLHAHGICDAGDPRRVLMDLVDLEAKIAAANDKGLGVSQHEAAIAVEKVIQQYWPEDD